MILPWTVLQELDGLRKRNSGAQAAINYINQLLVEKHPKLRPQRPSEVALSKEEFVGSNEDDTILQCALHWCGKVKSNTVSYISVPHELTFNLKDSTAEWIECYALFLISFSLPTTRIFEVKQWWSTQAA